MGRKKEEREREKGRKKGKREIDLKELAVVNVVTVKAEIYRVGRQAWR